MNGRSTTQKDSRVGPRETFLSMSKGGHIERHCRPHRDLRARFCGSTPTPGARHHLLEGPPPRHSSGNDSFAASPATRRCLSSRLAQSDRSQLIRVTAASSIRPSSDEGRIEETRTICRLILCLGQAERCRMPSSTNGGTTCQKVKRLSIGSWSNAHLSTTRLHFAESSCRNALAPTAGRGRRDGRARFHGLSLTTAGWKTCGREPTY